MTISRRTTTLVAAGLLAAYAVLSLLASLGRGPAFDETAHIAAGYNVWLRHDLRFDPGNGDFIKRWATLPLLALRPVFPDRLDSDWRNAEFFAVGYKLLFKLGNDPLWILLVCRAMVMVLAVALGALVFSCSRCLFGNVGALISLSLYCFCPSMQAYGALVSTEIAAALGLLASTWFVWRLLHNVSWLLLIASLAAFGILVISKMSAVLMLPIVVVLVVIRLCNRGPWTWAIGRPRTITQFRTRVLLILALGAAHLAAAFGCIWAAYDFRFLASPDPSDPGLIMTRPAGASTPPHGLVAETIALCRRARALPEGYLSGMEAIAGISDHRPSFLNGTWRAGGTRWFFPYAFWAKTPPALLIILLVASLGWVTRTFWYEATPFMVLFAIYGAAAVSQDVNIGHRHILPLYPVLYILAGSVATGIIARTRWRAGLVGLLVIWFSADSLSVWPHSLSYFSPVVGGPSHGYLHLVDSSLDWGQDLPEVGEWLDAHNAGRQPVYFSYFGTGDPDYYGIKSMRLEGFPDWRDKEVYALTPGIYVIGATMFQNLYTQPFGPWTQANEQEYQMTILALGLSETRTNDTDTLADVLQRQPEARWQDLYSRYEKLRFSRLCAWLRSTRRAPDAEVGYSILVWRLDRRALHDALWATPLEVRE